ncbi:MAG TPA: VOC family protein [Thermoanaerobaculia bacterium]|jgi:catechol 2,3-dioxygenase-like lactoylglutathione lyase family enzyme|nr:VOC family protein [Thermoanaerobaculia bacterium]
MTSPDPRPNVRQAVPFFRVQDIERSLRFYEDGLGFRMTKSWRPEGKLRWCWLELDDVVVMLQEFWKEGSHENVPLGGVGVGVSIAFTCEDAVALWRDFRSRGVEAKRPFVGNGMWVTEVSDPDGYALTFESRTDAPEESELPDES